MSKNIIQLNSNTIQTRGGARQALASDKPEGDGAASDSRSHKPEGDGAASYSQSQN